MQITDSLNESSAVCKDRKSCHADRVSRILIGWMERERKSCELKEEADHSFSEEAAQQLEGDNAGALGQMRSSRLAMFCLRQSRDEETSEVH